MTFFSCNVLNGNYLECVSMMNTYDPLFYPYRITINKCKGSCNTVNDPNAKLCVPDTIKNIN